MTPVAVFVRQRESWWQHEHLARAVPALLSCELRSRHRPVLTVARSGYGAFQSVASGSGHSFAGSSSRPAVTQVIGLSAYRVYGPVGASSPDLRWRHFPPALLQTPRWPVSSTFRDHRIEFSLSLRSWVVHTTFSQISTITSSRSQLGCRLTHRPPPQLGQAAARPLDVGDGAKNLGYVR
jgi:hypothetical protein